VAAVIALAAGWQLASAQGEKEQAVQKWEYRAIAGGQDSIPSRETIRELAQLGDDGWELVAVEPAAIYVQGGSTNHGYRVYHLKRPK